MMLEDLTEKTFEENDKMRSARDVENRRQGISRVSLSTDALISQVNLPVFNVQLPALHF